MLGYLQPKRMSKPGPWAAMRKISLCEERLFMTAKFRAEKNYDTFQEKKESSVRRYREMNK